MIRAWLCKLFRLRPLGGVWPDDWLESLSHPDSLDADGNFKDIDGNLKEKLEALRRQHAANLFWEQAAQGESPPILVIHTLGEEP